MSYKLRQGPPTITIQFSPEDFDMIHQFAHRAGMSVAQVAKLGMIRLINDAESGVVELLPEYQGGSQPGHC